MIKTDVVGATGDTGGVGEASDASGDGAGAGAGADGADRVVAVVVTIINRDDGDGALFRWARATVLIRTHFYQLQRTRDARE